jgi:hypothetical protein
MVLTFSYFVVPEIFKNWNFICFFENSLLTVLWRPYRKTFRIYVPAVRTVRTVRAVRTMVGFRNRLCSVNRVSETCFVRLLAGFSKPDMTVNILSGSSAADQKGIHIYKRLTETRKKLSISGSSKDLHN